MSLKLDIGPRGYNQGLGVATLSTSPPNDRALIVRRVNISNVSATDDWTFTVGQRELMRIREVSAVGNQHMLRVSDSSTQPKPDFWEFCRDGLGLDPAIPVPLGMTLVVASVGGATADIDVEFKEVDIADGNTWPTNHYQKGVFILPLQWRLNASQSAAGVIQLDTQTGPPYIPNLFGNIPLPVNWRVELLALFLESGGVNTFSGAANHQSVIQDFHWFMDQRQILTRIGHGLPAMGSASAAGSANTVFGQRSGVFRPFELNYIGSDPVLDVPIVLGGGETLQQLVDITGDLTGGASYANFLQTAIARVTIPGSAFGGG